MLDVTFPYVRPADHDVASPVRYPVIVVGAGPVGLATAIDLAQSGIPVLVLDDDAGVANGSRAICFAKRTLEIFDRLGCGEAMVGKGVEWQRGKVFFHDRLAYSFDLLPETGHQRPAFINLQQYYVERFLLDRARTIPGLEIRWHSRVVAVDPAADGVAVTVETPDGRYSLAADWLIAADGSRSPTRQLLGLESSGRVFRDRFLIADVRMSVDFPTERWFWFDPPFHPGGSVLLHKQPGGVWRIDFQLGWDADPVAERQPERVIPRVRALLGGDAAFELEWVSVYTFACQRMEQFRHGRIIFAGDSAHGVSPFGARGANSGIQDAENLAWKLRLVVQGQAPERLLDSYDAERVFAADENIRASTRSTDFITPKSEVSRLFRDAVLQLAQTHPFARRLVNSGRLSVPAVLLGSKLNTPDRDDWAGGLAPGTPAADAPIRVAGQDGWFLGQLGGDFTLVVFAGPPIDVGATPVALRQLVVGQDGAGVQDLKGHVARRYDARPGTAYLLRPDQHVCARWRHPNAVDVQAALRRAIASC